MGEAKIGTTGRGIGPAYEDKVARRAIRVQDLFARERFAAKLGEVLDYHNFVLRHYFKAPTIDFQETLDEALAARRATAADGRRRLRRSERADPRRQARAVRRRAGCAARHRSRHVSVRDVEQLRGGPGVGGRGRRSAAAALRARRREGLCDARRQRPVSDRARRRSRRAAARARQRIRLGDGSAASLRLVRCGGPASRGRDQRHHRACASPSSMCSTASTRCASPSATKCAASGAICCRSVPTRCRSARRSTKSMPGWKESTEGVKSFDDLPKNAQSYLRRLEVLVGAPIAIISTGPDRARDDRSAPSVRLAFSRQREPVADGQQAQVDALVAMQLVVQGAQRDGVRLAFVGIENRARPQRVVERHQSARPQ